MGMKCPHCGSLFVVHSENRAAHLLRAVAQSNKWHCGECHGKWKTRRKNQDHLARELLAILLVGLLGFIVLKIFTNISNQSRLETAMVENGGVAGKSGAGSMSDELTAQAVLNGKNFSAAHISKASSSQKVKFRDMMRGGGMEGFIAKMIAEHLGGRKLTESLKKQLKEQHKDLIRQLSDSDKQKIRDTVKKMNL